MKYELRNHILSPPFIPIYCKEGSPSHLPEILFYIRQLQGNMGIHQPYSDTIVAQKDRHPIMWSCTEWIFHTLFLVPLRYNITWFPGKNQLCLHLHKPPPVGFVEVSFLPLYLHHIPPGQFPCGMGLAGSSIPCLSCVDSLQCPEVAITALSSGGTVRKRM